jgi:hypothetical protein
MKISTDPFEDGKIYRFWVRGDLMTVKVTDPKTGKIEVNRYLRGS